MLVSVHVPKCGGTSFRQILYGLFGSRVWFNYEGAFSQAQVRPELVPAGTSVIHGHFLADAFDRAFPDRRLMTWVREPVERVVSNYQHFLRSPDMRDDCCRALHERKLDLRGFADLEWMRNMATRYLANKPVEDFEFIGVTECFEESAELFYRTFGYRRVGSRQRANANPGRTSEFYPISGADRDYILERNQEDRAWYERAVARLANAGKSSMSA
jgi:hypothetical protein